MTRSRTLTLLLGVVLGCTPKSPATGSRAKAAAPSASVVAAPSAVAPATPYALPAGQPPWLLPHTPELEAALAHDATELQRLRAVPSGTQLSCEQFRSLGLAAGLAKRRAHDEHPTNECSDAAARIVSCIATSSGLFVPVEEVAGLCSYRLWFVARNAAQRPVPVSEVLEEFDLAFTVRLEADDADGDGVEEALLIRGWSSPEGVGDGQWVYGVKPNGEQLPLPFGDFKDVDGDGRLDATLSFARTVNAAGCEPPDAPFEPWVPGYLNGPELVLHRLAGFKFSLTDAVSRGARAKFCKNLGSSVIARRRGAVDEDETLRRAVCRLADGGDPAEVGRALAEACTRDFERPADCKKARPGVCFWRSDLLNVPTRFEGLRPWLAAP